MFKTLSNSGVKKGHDLYIWLQTSVRKRKKMLSFDRTGCDARRSRKFSRPTLRRSTKSGSRLSAESLCHTNSACKRRGQINTSKIVKVKTQIQQFPYYETGLISSTLFYHHFNLTHPFLWQWRDDDIGISDQEICSEKLKLTVASPQSVRCHWCTSFWDWFSWPSGRKQMELNSRKGKEKKIFHPNVLSACIICMKNALLILIL